MKMPFGKHKDIDICFISSGYLKYLLGEDWFIEKDNDLVVEVEKEYKRRDETGQHFWDTKVVNKK